MTPMEAWGIVSANLAHLVRIRRSQGDPKGYVNAETEAEVITFRALKEMQERMYPQPLSLKEIAEMQDQPVFVIHNDLPEKGYWGIVESAGKQFGEKYLYLQNAYGCINPDSVTVYRHKPAEVKNDV